VDAPYRTEARIEPPNNGSRARHALLHMASECLTHWTTWAGASGAESGSEKRLGPANDSSLVQNFCTWSLQLPLRRKVLASQSRFTSAVAIMARSHRTQCGAMLLSVDVQILNCPEHYAVAHKTAGVLRAAANSCGASCEKLHTDCDAVDLCMRSIT